MDNMLMLVYISSFLCLTDAFRIGSYSALNSAMNQQTTGQAQAGQMLRNRFRLEKFVERRSKAGAIPGVSFPTISSKRRKFTGRATHLGTGSFGDVWEAFDTHLNKNVAVKIFYQGSSYMTWKNADSRGLKELEDSAQECNLVKDILKAKHRKMYPIGAARICECYDEFITDAKGTNEAVFLVQEMCGRGLDKALIQSQRDSKSINYLKAREATKQMLEAVAFLQMFNPPLIHHDLKPANVCINGNDEVKVIDWGGMVFGKSDGMFKSAAATPLYTPPEAAQGVQAFAQPWHSYDAYAVGLMHMYFLCPDIEHSDWYYSKPLTKTLVRSTLRKRCYDYFNATNLYGNVEQDIDLIDKLSNSRATLRLAPMKLLDHAALIDTETPAILEDEVEQLLQFKVNDRIKYWSESHGKYILGVVKRVDQVNGVYDLVHEDGEKKLRNGADPGRVTARDEDLDASVAENLLIPVGELREGNGLMGASVIDPVGHMGQNGYVQAPVLGNKAGKLPYSSYVSLDAPLLRWTRTHGLLEVKTFVGCNYGATCDVKKVTMLCRDGNTYDAPKKMYEAKTEVNEDHTALKAKIYVSPDEDTIGQRCELEAEADISDAPLTETGMRRSFAKYITLSAGRRLH